MINLYFKNFNFNLSGSIGIMLSSELEKEDFIKRINELEIDYKFYSFEALKTHFDFNGKITSPLNFPFRDINKFLSARVIILEDIKIKCLWDAVLFNAICDFVLNNRIVFCIRAENGFNINNIFSSYLNYDKNSYEYLILDIYKTRLIFLIETRMVKDNKYGGYTSSMANIIYKINALGFHINKNKKKPENYDKTGLFFFDDKKFEIKLTIVPLKKIVDSNGEFISKNGISINTTLTDIYLYPGELINKIKIFLGTTGNVRKPVHCSYNKNKNKTNKTGLGEMSTIQDISIKEIFSPHLVIAGAGSGKTGIIVNKFLYLSNFISADSIIILTFTNNAATEIKNRIASSFTMNNETNNNLTYDKVLNISTYHSFFYSIIKEFYKELGFKSTPLIKENDNNSGENTKNVFISYDEIILYVLKLFKNQDIVYDIASRFKYVLVDEYQDLDFFSDYIIKKLDFARGAVMYAGDDDQAIYGFNGGDSLNILFFDLFFPSGKIFVFQNNYRSHYKIIDFCNLIINKIAFRYPKKLLAKNKRGEKNGNNNIVNILQFKNKNLEEKFVKKMSNKFNSQGKSTAILVRTKKEENSFKAVPGFNKSSYVGTIHKSKGLEFDIIFIVNVSNGNIPHLRSMFPTVTQRKISKHPFAQFLNDKIKLETGRDDEVKLFYVAASRAKEKVFITYSGEISEFLMN